MLMIALSLIANVAITFTVVFAIWRNTTGLKAAFGPDTPARRILACLYLTIGVISLLTLLALAFGFSDRHGNMYIVSAVVIFLLPFQILYKLMTIAALGIRHPVVLANLGVVVLHTITLFSLFPLF